MPAAILAAVTSFTDVGQAVLGPAVERRLEGVTPDHILPFTLAAAIVSGAVILVVLHRRTSLHPVRSLLVALGAIVGAVGAFEIPYQAIRDAVYPATNAPGVGYHSWLALGAWVILGFTGLGYWKVSRRWLLLFGATVAGFLGWWAVGYPQVTSSMPDQVDLGYLFNVPLKFAAFALFCLPVVEGVRRHARAVEAPVDGMPEA